MGLIKGLIKAPFKIALAPVTVPVKVATKSVKVAKGAAETTVEAAIITKAAFHSSENALGLWELRGIRRASKKK
jgi:hypothetical protein